MKWLLLFVVFIVVPIAELAVIIQVGNLIGGLWTVLLLFASAFLGSWLLRREGRRTWRAFTEAINEHRVPTREVADGALVILGAALMVTPGFLTDITGMLCLLPPTRAILRRVVVIRVLHRMMARSGVPPQARVRARRGPGRPYQEPAASAPPGQPKVIEGEVEP